MKKLLIVYHSQSGATERLAAAVEEGARRIPAVSVERRRAAQTDSEALVACDLLVLCSPEYFGYMAGAIKDMFDRTYEESRERTVGKPFAMVVSSGNDGTGSILSMERIIAGYRMRRVQEPIICQGPVSASALDECGHLGETLAAGMELGIY